MSSDAKVQRMMREHSPRVLPAGWELREEYLNARVYWRLRPRFLSVIAEVDEYGGRLWLHVSCAARKADNEPALPSWEELKGVKDLFCGRDACALQVLPPEAEYVNVNPVVLHLWVALEGPRPNAGFHERDQEPMTSRQHVDLSGIGVVLLGYYDGDVGALHVYSYCPTPEPTVPPTQVHLHIPGGRRSGRHALQG